MSLIPAFEIGVWNAWILMAYLLLLMPFFLRIATKKGSPSPQDSGLSALMSILAGSSKILLVPALVYSVFLPLELGTTWFYAGLPVALIGLITSVLVIVNWFTAPIDQPVTGGPYRFSRHPMYVTLLIFFVGLGIATASWIFLLYSIIWIASCSVSAKVEEQSCLDKYGDTYRKFMNRTPRWIGIPK